MREAGSAHPIHVDSVTTSCLSLSLLSTAALTAALLLWPSGVAAHLTHLHAAPGPLNPISISALGLVIQRVFVSAPSAAAVRSLSLAMVAAVLLPLAAALQAVKVSAQPFSPLSPSTFKMLNTACLAGGLLSLPTLVQAVSMRGPLLAGFAALFGMVILTAASCLRTAKGSGQRLLPAGFREAVELFVPTTAAGAVYVLESIALSVLGCVFLSASPTLPHPLLVTSHGSITILSSRLLGAGLLAASIMAFALSRPLPHTNRPPSTPTIAAPFRSPDLTPLTTAASASSTPTTASFTTSPDAPSTAGGATVTPSPTAPTTPSDTTTFTATSRIPVVAAAPQVIDFRGNGRVVAGSGTGEKPVSKPAASPYTGTFTADSAAPLRSVNAALAVMSLLLLRSLTLGPAAGLATGSSAMLGCVFVLAAVMVWSAWRALHAPIPPIASEEF
ncbi:MAG: hypothetical protein WDW36_000903 [Sanguina aurantia]